MTKIFEHILIPYNGTYGSNKSFRKAVLLAPVTHAKITILIYLEERPTFGFFKTKTSKQEFEKESKKIEKQQTQLEKYSRDHDRHLFYFCDFMYFLITKTVLIGDATYIPRLRTITEIPSPNTCNSEPSSAMVIMDKV